MLCITTTACINNNDSVTNRAYALKKNEWES